MKPDARQAGRRGEQGWALTRLIGLHNGMRNDLALLRRAVAAATEDGAEAYAAAAALDDLSFRQPGWSLQAYCTEICGSCTSTTRWRTPCCSRRCSSRQARSPGCGG